MENDANLEQMYIYPKQDNSNELFKNCKGKRPKIQKAFSQTNETKTSKKLKKIFIIHKKELTTISKKRKKSIKIKRIKRPRHKTINRKRHIIFHVSKTENKTEKNILQEKKSTPPPLGVKFNKFKIKKIEHRKEKKYKTKEKQNIINNDSAETEENYEINNNVNLLYEGNDYSDFYSQDERIGKETLELINTLSVNRENFERPFNPNLDNLDNMPRLNRPDNNQPRTLAFTLVIKEIK